MAAADELEVAHCDFLHRIDDSGGSQLEIWNV